jgi:pimeloyl-ACP methyl ester carboxylesterase
MAEDPRLVVGAIQVACGDYRRFLRFSSLALDDQERWLVNGEMVLDDDYSDEIDDIEPIGRAEDFPPRPLLLLSGAEDPSIPPACVESTANVFGAAYARAGTPDHFEWIELEGRGHNPGPEAEELVLDFFTRWLEPPGSTRRR